MIFVIKTDNIKKIIDTDDFIEENIDAILDNEIHNLREEERQRHGSLPLVVDVEEIDEKHY